MYIKLSTRNDRLVLEMVKQSHGFSAKFSRNVTYSQNFTSYVALLNLRDVRDMRRVDVSTLNVIIKF